MQPKAALLSVRARGSTAILGITDDQGWEPLLRLGHPSDACNVMSLDVRHHNRWTPTFNRGTPTQLAAILTGELQFLWWTWVNDLGLSRTSGQEH